MSEELKQKKPFYKKWWVWVIVAVVVIAGVANQKKSVTSTSGSDSDTAKTVETTVEKKPVIKNANPIGIWRNTGDYGENQMRLFSTGKFMITVPTGESWFGKWEQIGSTISFEYDDGSTETGKIRGDRLHLKGADWYK